MLCSYYYYHSSLLGCTQKVHCHQLYPIEQYANAHRNAMEQLLRRGQLPPPLQLPADQLHNYVTGGADALFAAATAVASSNVKLPSGLSVHYEAAEVSGPSQTTATTTTTTTVAACQLWFELRISRDNLLEDLLTSLQNTLLDDPAVLRLPLRSVEHPDYSIALEANGASIHEVDSS